MKKALVVLLILAVAGGVFAQELKFTGYVNTGLGLVIPGEDDADPYLTAYGQDAEQFNYRFQLNGFFTNSAGNAGLSFRLRAQGNRTPFMHWAYGWYTGFDGMITVKAGSVDDGTYNTMGYVIDGDVDEGIGALVNVSPIDGLSLGVGAYVGKNDASGSLQRELDDAKYTFGIAYDMPDLFKVAVGYRTKSAFDTARLRAGVNIKVLPELTAVIEVEADNLDGDFGDFGTFTIAQTLAYKIGDITVGVNLGEYLSMEEDTDFSFMANPWVSYAIGSIVPRLDFVYFLNGYADLVTDSSDPEYGNWTGKFHRKAYMPTYTEDYAFMSIRPSVAFMLNNTTIEVGYMFNMLTEPDGIDYDNNQNIIYVDFKWSF
ncbi:hypothetical protein [Breznakiella homolactica]|uniref:Porin n=1 Tax=Breznakiella homolactica TaxID=2798577 RepID=A0A7T7XQG9_9SPIR|nr:hypothetical protein [Breznakiella homolactica]QQO10619.1 hypothetical protein JFL75_06800 [Breznakiella homolactica]